MSQLVSSQVLSNEVRCYRRFRNILELTYPDIDDTGLADTLEGITNLHELISEVLRSSLVDQAMAAGLKIRLEEMRQRLSRLESNSQKKRQLALNALRDAEIKKLIQPDFTVSVRAGTQVANITDAEKIPGEFWIPQPDKLDRAALLNALKSGKDISGASLSDSEPTLSVRRK